MALPMYVHPVQAEAAWARLTRQQFGAGFVVLNVADGPGATGDSVDSVYRDMIAELLGAGVPVTGYVDAAYGRREVSAIAVDARRWRDRYEVAAVFVDQAPSSSADVAQTTGMVERLRDDGVRRVVLNPGTVPDESLAGLADVLVTFEGTWANHRRHHPPEWITSAWPGSVCHLVHTVPWEVTAQGVVDDARRGGAGVVGLSRRPMPNPWRG